MGFMTILYKFIHPLEHIVDLENLQAAPHKIISSSSISILFFTRNIIIFPWNFLANGELYLQFNLSRLLRAKSLVIRVLTSTFCLPKRAIPIAFIGHCSWTPPGRIFVGFLKVVKGSKIQMVHIVWLSFWPQNREHQTNKKIFRSSNCDTHLKYPTQSVAHFLSLVDTTVVFSLFESQNNQELLTLPYDYLQSE